MGHDPKVAKRLTKIYHYWGPEWKFSTFWYFLSVFAFKGPNLRFLTKAKPADHRKFWRFTTSD